MDGRIWLSILTPAVQDGRRPTPISLLDCSMDGTVHCGADDHDSIKLLAMAVVADGKKGGLSSNGCRNVPDVLRLVTALSFFLSFFLSLSRLSSVLACSGYCVRTFQDLAACCLLGYISDANSRHLFKNHAMHTNITDMLRETALIALLCHARSLPQHS